eukprot:7510862-Lingulodinium_polyedra.AAC.1
MMNKELGKCSLMSNITGAYRNLPEANTKSILCWNSSYGHPRFLREPTSLNYAVVKHVLHRFA